MLDAGNVERQAVGRQGVYRASTASPLFQPLHDLVEKSVGVEAYLKALLEKTPGLEGAAVFGSWARGRIDAESDVDLLVVGDIDYGAMLEELMPLQTKDWASDQRCLDAPRGVPRSGTQRIHS